MSKIKSVHAREILDSRGNPTIEVDLELNSGSFGRAAVPSGASTGSHEAVELRDNDPKRYGGKGLEKAVNNVNITISKTVTNNDYDQKKLDQTLIDLDGTANKGNLGANAILGVSMAFSRAVAVDNKTSLAKYFNSLLDGVAMQLPVPMINIINGGKHAENASDIQEFMIIPFGFSSFKEALRAGAEIFASLKSILHNKGFATTVGDEGGFAPKLDSNENAILMILEAIKKANYRAGKDIAIAMDVAATELYKDGQYILERDKKTLTSEQMVLWYEELVDKYPIISIEDGLAEDDWEGYKLLTNKLGSKIQLVGDDLFVTNIQRLSTGIEKNIANSILIKLNQIGTVSETIDAINLANKASYTSVISNRSGETEDSTIADFAVGTGVGQIKTGSISRSDRTAKYNQLLRIEESLADKAIYPGKKAFLQV